MTSRRMMVSVSEDEYRDIVTAASEAQGNEGKPVSLAEWIRRAIREKLDK